MGTGIDIRVDPHRDPGLLAHAARHPIEALQLGFRLQIETEDLFIQRQTHLGFALGHPGEDHFGRVTARRQKTRDNSPPETMSNPEPRRASRLSSARLELAFTA